MDKKEDKPLRYSDFWLRRYADELEHNIKVKMKYSHITDAKEELLLELVRRELERLKEEWGVAVTEGDDEGSGGV